MFPNLKQHVLGARISASLLNLAEACGDDASNERADRVTRLPFRWAAARSLNAADASFSVIGISWLSGVREGSFLKRVWVETKKWTIKIVHLCFFGGPSYERRIRSKIRNRTIV